MPFYGVGESGELNRLLTGSDDLNIVTNRSYESVVSEYLSRRTNPMSFKDPRTQNLLTDYQRSHVQPKH